MHMASGHVMSVEFSWNDEELLAVPSGSCWWVF